MKKIIKWVLIAIVTLLVIGIFTSPSTETSDNMNDSNTIENVSDNSTINSTESTMELITEESTTFPEITTEESTTEETTTKKEITATDEIETTIVNVITTQIETTKKQIVETTNGIETTIKEIITIDPDAQVTVYVTATGKRYHYENPCGNGTYYPSTLADAKSRGLTPCDKCVLH